MFKYTIYSPRTGDDAINIGDSRAGLAIGVMHRNNGQVVAPDPRLLNITARLVERDASWNFYTVQKVELEHLD